MASFSVKKKLATFGITPVFQGLIAIPRLVWILVEGVRSIVHDRVVRVLCTNWRNVRKVVLVEIMQMAVSNFILVNKHVSVAI